uniref:Uncharacterized protein n=1 Tax=Lepeophtheirus salmonis TaxID=72036 RepID=A0A0K2T644_LEPSM
MYLYLNSHKSSNALIDHKVSSLNSIIIIGGQGGSKDDLKKENSELDNFTKISSSAFINLL